MQEKNLQRDITQDGPFEACQQDRSKYLSLLKKISYFGRQQECCNDTSMALKNSSPREASTFGPYLSSVNPSQVYICAQAKPKVWSVSHLSQTSSLSLSVPTLMVISTTTILKHKRLCCKDPKSGSPCLPSKVVFRLGHLWSSFVQMTHRSSASGVQESTKIVWRTEKKSDPVLLLDCDVWWSCRIRRLSVLCRVVLYWESGGLPWHGIQTTNVGFGMCGWW